MVSCKLLVFETAVTDLEFNKIITAIYPKPEKDNKKAIKRWENNISLINDIYFDSPTQQNIKGNAWGVFNALTEKLDYFGQVRKSANTSETQFANASGFDAMRNANKNKLFRQVKQLAGVK
jgi:hypothetical protein